MKTCGGRIVPKIHKSGEHYTFGCTRHCSKCFSFYPFDTEDKYCSEPINYKSDGEKMKTENLTRQEQEIDYFKTGHKIKRFRQALIALAIGKKLKDEGGDVWEIDGGEFLTINGKRQKTDAVWEFLKDEDEFIVMEPETKFKEVVMYAPVIKDSEGDLTMFENLHEEKPELGLLPNISTGMSRKVVGYAEIKVFLKEEQ